MYGASGISLWLVMLCRATHSRTKVDRLITGTHCHSESLDSVQPLSTSSVCWEMRDPPSSEGLFAAVITTPSACSRRTRSRSLVTSAAESIKCVVKETPGRLTSGDLVPHDHHQVLALQLCLLSTAVSAVPFLSSGSDVHLLQLVRALARAAQQALHRHDRKLGGSRARLVAPGVLAAAGIEQLGADGGAHLLEHERAEGAQVLVLVQEPHRHLLQHFLGCL